MGHFLSEFDLDEDMGLNRDEAKALIEVMAMEHEAHEGH